MQRFKIWTAYNDKDFYIAETQYGGKGLHSDGSILNTREFWPTREQAQAVLDKYQPRPKNPLIGKTVVVYDRYHFALPLKGRIQDVSEKDGAFKVSFYSKQHGYPNYLKMDHKYFFSEQCHIIDDDPQPTQPAHVWQHGDVFNSAGMMMIYLKPGTGPVAINLLREDGGGTPRVQLLGSTFLFNIRSKLPC